MISPGHTKITIGITYPPPVVGFVASGGKWQLKPRQEFTDLADITSVNACEVFLVNTGLYNETKEEDDDAGTVTVKTRAMYPSHMK